MHFRKMKFEHQIIAIALLIAFEGLLLFLTLVPVQPWLWLGWLYGFAAMMIGHLMSALLIKFALKKIASKSGGFGFGLARIFLNYILQAGFFVILIVIDNAYAGDALIGRNLENLVHGPINIFTYLGALGVIAIATILMLAFRKRKQV